MPQTFRGRAQIEGVAGTFDVIAHHIAQSLGMTQEFEEDINQDQHGDDIAWRARNEKLNGDVSMKLIATDASSRATVATAATFLNPYAIVTLSGFEVTLWNTTWQVISGGGLNQTNTAVGEQTYKLRRYRDTTQNALAATIPT